MDTDFAAGRARGFKMKWLLWSGIALVTITSAVAGKPPAGGFRGVPWIGSRDDFKKAIPTLTCYPIDCRGTMYVGDIATELDVTWGGFAAHATSITLTFPAGRVSDMAKVLRTKYGAPSDQHREDGELVSRWRLPDVIVYLYHGSATEHNGVVYFEPTAQLKIQKDEFKAWKKQQAEKQKHSMRDASSAW
jgi:hypothetical protein